MRAFFPIRIFLFSLFVIVSSLAYASEPQLEVMQGKWLGTDTFPNGAKLETKVLLNSDGSFTGEATVDAKPIWNYSGTWQLAAGKITWTYLSSSLPLPDSAKVDVDEVLSITDSELVLKSQLSGKIHTFQRSQ